MNNTDRIRDLLEQIRDTEQRLAELRVELAKLVEQELGVDNSTYICLKPES